MGSSQFDVYDFAAKPVIESILNPDNKYLHQKIKTRCVARFQRNSFCLWTNIFWENTYHARSQH